MIVKVALGCRGSMAMCGTVIDAGQHVSYPPLKGVSLSLALPAQRRLASETIGLLTVAHLRKQGMPKP